MNFRFASAYPHRVKARMLLLSMLVLAGRPVAAQEGLYAPSVPEDAALVRVVNATGETVTLDVGPVRFRDVASRTATAYRPFQGDVVVIAHAGDREVLTPRARSFLSIVLKVDGVLAITDERHTDPARAQLVLYNLTGAPLDFVAVEPGATLAAGVEPGAGAARVVNAIPLRLGAVSAGTLVHDESLGLQRGESYTMVVADEGGDVFGFVVQATVESE